MIHAKMACVVTSLGCDVGHIARCVWRETLVVLGVMWVIFTPAVWRAAHWFLAVGTMHTCEKNVMWLTLAW